MFGRKKQIETQRKILADIDKILKGFNLIKEEYGALVRKAKKE